jgi:hypothetical protein
VLRYMVVLTELCEFLFGDLYITFVFVQVSYRNL